MIISSLKIKPLILDLKKDTEEKINKYSRELKFIESTKEKNEEELNKRMGGLFDLIPVTTTSFFSKKPYKFRKKWFSESNFLYIIEQMLKFYGGYYPLTTPTFRVGVSLKNVDGGSHLFYDKAFNQYSYAVGETHRYSTELKLDDENTLEVIIVATNAGEKYFNERIIASNEMCVLKHELDMFESILAIIKLSDQEYVQYPPDLEEFIIEQYKNYIL